MEHTSKHMTTDRVRQADGRHMTLRVLAWSVGGAVLFLALLVMLIVFGTPR